MFPYESDYYWTEEYPRISKGINETDNVVYSHSFDMCHKGNQLRNNIGGTAADNHKASDSSNGTIY